MTDVEGALEQQVLDIAQAQREADVPHHNRRMTSGDELKHLNGPSGTRGKALPCPMRFKAQVNRCYRWKVWLDGESKQLCTLPALPLSPLHFSR